ncbi:MAG: ParB/RepB/Spo0J family partition protein [Hyphomonadaceae bacterium]|nr:ParB/RepB/Spo0J family partition protein [Hyphomonadaceae bacterium]
MSDLPQVIQYIPLNKLVASPRNVRRRHPKADIESLAASIHSRGLLQNLCVVPGEKDCFEVEAGGRRRLALKLLAKQGKIAKDWPVPCQVVAREDGIEVSLTENVHRVAMDAMDEVDAYAALVAEGKTPDEVGRRFGVERRHVDQRLALAGLSPRIKAAWKRGDVSLDAARAFCLVDDHAQQDAVFRSLGKPVTHGPSVRARLMDGRMRTTDRLAVFVGLETYEAAGGKVLRDLFDPEAVFIEAPALLTKLAEDKLAASRDTWLAQGWSWVDLNLGAGRGDGLSSTRLHPEWRDPTAEEQAELDRISGEIEALDAELDANGVEDDPRWTERDDLEAAFETIRQAGRCWTGDVMALSGVMLSIDHDGEVSVSEGLVRTDDQKRVDAYFKQRRAGNGAESEDDGIEDGPAGHVSALPKAVNRDLTLARTRAIRVGLLGELDVALALCVAALAARSVHRAEFTGVAISAQARTVDDLPDLEDARALMEGQIPSEDDALLGWALDLSRERLLAVLAVLVAGSVDLSHEDTSPVDLRKQAIADSLARHLDIDMTRYWTAGPDFWTRLPKSALMSALSDAPSMPERSARAREDAIKAHAKLRKDELAAKVSALLEGSHYLPDILVTPVAIGGLAVPPQGAAAIALPAVAAE